MFLTIGIKAPASATSGVLARECHDPDYPDLDHAGARRGVNAGFTRRGKAGLECERSLTVSLPTTRPAGKWNRARFHDQQSGRSGIIYAILASGVAEAADFLFPGEHP